LIEVSENKMKDLKDLFSRDALSMEPSPIRELAKLAAKPGVISLAGGQPSEEAFPLEEIREVMAGLVSKLPARALQYGLTKGDEELRETAVGMMARRGIEAKRGEVILTNGSQRALDLIGRILIDPGDAVITEMPTYSGAIACFHNLRARLIGVPQDEHGLRIDQLEGALERARAEGLNIKLLYLIPTFQNPSGATLSPERRKELVDLSRRENLLILEDDPYSELFFDEEPPALPLASLLPENVLYLSSFSKILAPGLRTAFLKGPVELIRAIELAAQASDLSAGTHDQRLILELCRSGVMRRSIENARHFYRGQRGTLLNALEEFMPASISWNKPRGGFFTWVTLPPTINTDKLLEGAIKQGVAFVPGRHFFVDGSGLNTLRICYSEQPAERLRQGTAALASAIRFYDLPSTIPWALSDGSCSSGTGGK
jgi:2-aminoadipate transaminase